MNTIRNICIATALLIGVSTAADARPPAPWGGGYYGSAWYSSGQGSVVAGASTWAECNSVLQDAISRALSWGWAVVTYVPCHYQAPFLYAPAPDDGIEIAAGSSGESAGVVRVITDEIVRVRTQYRADEYEASMRTIYQAAGGK
ncbi:MAG: hypothetical protein ABL934_18505 [Lysobacteraceae bacterium]